MVFVMAVQCIRFCLGLLVQFKPSLWTVIIGNCFPERSNMTRRCDVYMTCIDTSKVKVMERLTFWIFRRHISSCFRRWLNWKVGTTVTSFIDLSHAVFRVWKYPIITLLSIQFHLHKPIYFPVFFPIKTFSLAHTLVDSEIHKHRYYSYFFAFEFVG